MKRDLYLIVFALLFGSLIQVAQYVLINSDVFGILLNHPILLIFATLLIIVAVGFLVLLYLEIRNMENKSKKEEANTFKNILEENNTKLAQALRDVLRGDSNDKRNN